MPRSKPHFKAHTTIKAHRKMAAVYGDNDLLALWLRLGVEAIERYADRTGDSFLIHERELASLAGTKRRDSAEKLLLNLVKTSPILAQKSGETWRIRWPNFQRKQGFGQKNGVETGYSSTSSSSSTSSKSKKKTPSPRQTGEPLAAFWTEQYEKLRGVRCIFEKKDAVILHSLLKLTGEGTVGRNDLAHCIVAYLSDDSDEFLAKAGWSVPVFQKRFQGLYLQRVKEREKQATIRKRQDTASLERTARQVEPLLKLAGGTNGS